MVDGIIFEVMFLVEVEVFEIWELLCSGFEGCLVVDDGMFV